jgi:hypothetical protein
MPHCLQDCKQSARPCRGVPPTSWRQTTRFHDQVQGSWLYRRSLVTYLQYPSSRSRSSQLFNLDFAFSVFPYATAHRLSLASILSYLRSYSHIQVSYYVVSYLLLANNSSCCRCIHFWQTSSFAVSFTVIADPRAISSPCRYRYPPRSTEYIPLILHPVVRSYRFRHTSLSYGFSNPFVAPATNSRPRHPSHSSYPFASSILSLFLIVVVRYIRVTNQLLDQAHQG